MMYIEGTYECMFKECRKHGRHITEIPLFVYHVGGFKGFMRI